MKDFFVSCMEYLGLILIPAIVFAITLTCLVLNNYLLMKLGIHVQMPDRGVVTVAAVVSAITFSIYLTNQCANKEKKK